MNLSFRSSFGFLPSLPRVPALLRPHLNETSREFLHSPCAQVMFQLRSAAPLCWERSASNPSIKDISASLLWPIKGYDARQRSLKPLPLPEPISTSAFCLRNIKAEKTAIHEWRRASPAHPRRKVKPRPDPRQLNSGFSPLVSAS